MKLFLATNEATFKTDYKKMLEVSVKSALKNTDLEVYVIFDGDKNLLNLPPEVKIIEHRHRCYETMKNSKLCGNREDMIRIASGTYLRTEIPHLMKINGLEDDFCLYTDYDVIFQKLESAELENFKPEIIAVSPEFQINNWGIFNCGSTLMNLKYFQDNDDFIVNYINSNFENLLVWDQTMYTNLYSQKIMKWGPEYNWKPYWGVNENAKIIHFHGPKPFAAEPYEKSYSIPILKTLLDLNPSAYKHYNEVFDSFL